MARFPAGGILSPFVKKPTSSSDESYSFDEFAASIARYQPPEGGYRNPAQGAYGPLDLTSTLTSWPVRDQGGSAMCAAYVAAACIELATALKAPADAVPRQLSAGFLYWAARHTPQLPDQEDWDRGFIGFNNVVGALRENGICAISYCADAIGVSTPTEGAINDALTRQRSDLQDSVRRYPGKPPADPKSAETAEKIVAIILNELAHDQPVGVAFPVYPTSGGSNNWNDAGERDGTVEFPSGVDPDSHTGGHGVCIVGFDGNNYFRFRNSVGPEFATRHAIPGVTGYGYGRVAVDDVKNHFWGFFTLRSRDVPNP